MNNDPYKADSSANGVNENVSAKVEKPVEKRDDNSISAGITFAQCVVNGTEDFNKVLLFKKGPFQVRCDLCSCEVSSNSVLDSHINGSRHRKKIKALQIIKNLKELGEKGISVHSVDSQDVYSCEICSIKMNSAQQLEIHLGGNLHSVHLKKLIIKNLKELGEKGISVHSVDSQDVYSCEICSIKMNSAQQLEIHLGGTKHKNNVSKGIASHVNYPLSFPKSRVKPFSDEDFPPQKKKREDDDKKTLFCNICSDLLKSKTECKQVKALQIIRTYRELEEKGISVHSVDSQGIYSCQICSIRMNSATQLEIHLGGTKHKNRVSKGALSHQNDQLFFPKSRAKPFSDEDFPPQKIKKEDEAKKPLICEICDVMLNSETQYAQHLLAKKHKSKAKRSMQNKRSIQGRFQSNYHQGKQVASQWWPSKKTG